MNLRLIVGEDLVNRRDCYNVTLGGGIPPSNKGNKHTPETRNKMKRAWINRKNKTTMLGKRFPYSMSGQRRFLGLSVRRTEQALGLIKIGRKKKKTNPYSREAYARFLGISRHTFTRSRYKLFTNTKY